MSIKKIWTLLRFPNEKIIKKIKKLIISIEIYRPGKTKALLNNSPVQEVNKRDKYNSLLFSKMLIFLKSALKLLLI